jgi:signal transduction histidine kinase
MFSRPLETVRKGIGFRLALWSSAFFILSTLLLFAFAYFLLAASLKQNDRNNIEARLQQLTAQYQSTDLAGLKKQLALEARLRTTRPFFIRIAGPRNTTVFAEIPDEWAEFDLSPLEHAFFTNPGELIRLRAKDDDAVLEIASTRLPDGSLLQVGKSTDERNSFLERFGGIVAAVVIPIIVVGVLGGALLTRRMLRPIRQLIQTVRAIESGAMEARVPIRQTRDELDELGMLFNGMLNKIAALIQGMRGALDNVAHDLRTPVARMRGIAEVALQSRAEPEVCREALADCMEESEELLRMLNTLMDISEAESGTLRLNPEQVNIATLLADTVDLYQHVADEKAVTVSMAVPQQIWLIADRNRLRQVMANLLDNAIKYTREGGRIELTARSEERMAVIRVADTGIGMLPDELPKIWDRLYRGDASRSQRGLGLGLSLVKAVVVAHNGRVEASGTPGAGSVFTVFLPMDVTSDGRHASATSSILTKL